MSSERDTKFAGFAKLLNDDMHNRLDFWIDTAEPNFTEELQLIIAQRAYDLAWHVAGEMYLDAYKREPLDLIFGWVPDLTEWPAQEP